jgi:hypothetical protein
LLSKLIQEKENGTINGKSSVLAQNVLSFFEVAELLKLQQKIVSPPEPTTIPSSRLDNHRSSILQTDKALYASELNEVDRKLKSMEEGWTADAPYHAQITNAYWLTTNTNTDESTVEKWVESRKVIHMDINLGDSKHSLAPMTLLRM